MFPFSPTDPAMDSAERISRLQTSIEDLKRTYVTVKNKLAVLDRRRRKKITRKTGPGSRNNLVSLHNKHCFYMLHMFTWEKS